jgi:hypothetical protein
MNFPAALQGATRAGPIFLMKMGDDEREQFS